VTAQTPQPAFRRRHGWPHDLVLGVRLAVGGGRTSWARLVLGTIGIGLATAVLLVAASVHHILVAQDARGSASDPHTTPVAGVAPLEYAFGLTRFRDTDISARYVRATGPNSPVPPGLARLPGPDEIVLSPALAALLDSPDGALLRPRFPQHVIGRIGEAGLGGPQELRFVAGIPAGDLSQADSAMRVYGFGDESAARIGNPSVFVLLVVGLVALLIPILIMISVSSRIAGAARDRRLAALRLVGAGSRQVRRIAAAEALVPAATGLVLGGIAFLVGRQFMPDVQVFGISVFVDDVTAPWPLVVLIVVLVPVLAVASALFALRRTVIEPLGVVREGRPVRRRLWWRLVLTVFGIALLVLAHWTPVDGTPWVGLVAIGSAALLLGVPVLLPFLLERAVAALRGGAPAWQLAIRRLQLDSGTPARVVGGVAVVLAGAIAVQTMMVGTSAQVALPAAQASLPAGSYFVRADSSVAAATADALRRSGAVRGTVSMVAVDVTGGNGTDGAIGNVTVASCAVLRQLVVLRDCHDGDVFSRPDVEPPLRPGTRLATAVLPTADNEPARTFGHWTVPDNVRPLPMSAVGADVYGPASQLLVTPGAFAGVALPPDYQWWSLIRTDPARPDAVEYVRNALAGHPLLTAVLNAAPVELNADQKNYVEVRDGLLIGALFTLGLAGISLLVLGLEQVRERRRPLAMLSASGVPRSVLAMSMLWQVAVPVALGVVAAIGTGVGLAFLVLRISGTAFAPDWAAVGLFSAAAVVLVLLVTAATLPALRGATRLSALRTE
jgi:hypothetical protein